MKSFKDIIRNELQNRAVKNAVKELLNNIGTYVVDNKGKIIYHINVNEIEEFSKYEFKFPSINEIIARAKSLYSNFDETSLSSICYVFENVDFYRKAIISARSSNVIFSKCKFFDGITIEDANTVFIINHSVCNGGMDIKSNYLNLENFGLMLSNEDDINIMSKKTDIRKSSLVSDSANIRIESDNLSILNNSYLSARSLYVSATKLGFGNSNLKGKENIEIYYKDYDAITDNEVKAVTNLTEEELRRQLIGYLNTIKQELLKDNAEQEQKDSKPIQMILM